MLNNVKDFGADGDGITDDREAIRSAIDVAVSTGKAGILVPADTYRVSHVETQARRL
jgi:polygalacturonase